MRPYEKRVAEGSPASGWEPTRNIKPGFTIPQVVRMFYAEGVVPDFIPADLGKDEADEIDDSGLWTVDPVGNIRSDPMDLREANLMAGLPAADAPVTGDLAPYRADSESGAEPPAQTE